MVDMEQELNRLRRRNEELELLYETINDLAMTLSVREVLDRLIARVLRHLEAEIGSILLLGPDSKLRITASQGLPEEVVQETLVELGEGISGYVAARGEPLLVRDIENDGRFESRNNERYYTRSFISAPLLQEGDVRGVVNVNNKSSQQPFDESDLRLLVV